MNNSTTTLKLALSILFLMLAACAVSNSTIIATPQVQEGQALVESKDSAGLASTGEDAVVTAAIARSTPKKMEFLVVELDFSNLSSQAIEVFPATFAAHDDEQQVYTILSPAEHVAVLNDMYRREQQENQLDMGGGGSFIDSTGYTGSTNFSNTGATTQANTSGRNPSRDARFKKDVEAYLLDTLLPAGQNIDGNIWIALPQEPAELRGLVLTVPIGGENHSFRFSLNSL